MLDRNLTVSRLKITGSAAEGASLSSSASTLLEVRPSAPPVELHGLALNGGQVVIESSSTVDITGCRFGSASTRRRLQTSASERALMILGGSVAISDAVFERLPGGAIEVSGGDVSVHTTSFKKNRAERGGALLVSGGELRVHNSTFTENEANEQGGALLIESGEAELSTTIVKTNFRASQGTALIRAIGGNVVLKDETALLVGNDNDQLALNISHGAQVRYELPAPLGRYAFIQDGSSTYKFESGEHPGDFPFACPAGAVGDSAAALSQRSPACARVCPAGHYCGAGTIVPTECPVGSYCAAGSSAPTSCKPGTVGRRVYLTSDEGCEPCPKGSWCSAGSEVMCPEDTYQPRVNQSSAVACKRCAEFSESLAGSASVGRPANASRATMILSTTQRSSSVIAALSALRAAKSRVTLWRCCPCSLDTGARAIKAPI